ARFAWETHRRLPAVVARFRRGIVDLLRSNLVDRISWSDAAALRMKQLSKTIVERGEFATAILLTLLSITFHIIFFFRAGPLWRDEISSLALATKPTLTEFWKSLPLDPFPASYFLLLRGWNAVGLGSGDLAVRGLGLLIGLSLIAALWWSCYL